MEVVVVIVCVTVIDIRITSGIRSRRDKPAPGRLIVERVLLLVVSPPGEGGLELAETGLCSCFVTNDVIHHVDYLSKFGQCLEVLAGD